MVIDIYSKGEYPSDALSNFAPHAFVLDGVSCGSMEGFLQSLKTRSPQKQIEICALVGKQAKEAGAKRRLWRLMKTVWWRGERLPLFSDDLQRLIDRAYLAMYDQCPEFRRALLDTGERRLVHTMGRKDMRETILTEYQFTRRLTELKNRARQSGEDSI